jgi:hypothetical protein
MATKKKVAEKRSTPAAETVEVKLDPRNVNRHGERSLGAVEKSVKDLGGGRSIVVDKTGTIIGGEATYHAAVKAGLRLKPIHTSGDELVVVVRDDLDPDDPRRRLLAIADNRTSQLSDFDHAKLAAELEAIGQESEAALVEAAGFNAEELSTLLGSMRWDGVAEEDMPAFNKTTADGNAVTLVPLKVTEEQWAVIDQACRRLRTRESDAGVSVGRCLELICADYLAGE